MHIYSWEELSQANLIIDACYQGRRHGNAGDDPLTRLVGVSNQGGFRYLGTVDEPRMIVITTSMSDADWPDEIDPESGMLTYFGDNKKPGRELHATPRYGNRLLRDAFALAHGSKEKRQRCPPIFVFSSAGTWRDVLFRGLAVPGAVGLSSVEDLVAVWRSSGGQRFQNYRAVLTILDVPEIPRSWLSDIQAGAFNSEHAPARWRDWLTFGKRTPLRAIRSLEIRTRDQQMPKNDSGRAMLSWLVKKFADDPFAFEGVAARIAQHYLRSVASIQVTRPYRDGGRDAVGAFRIGDGPSGISVDFALEAKCYSPTNSVGVRETSRLISRLRHRQFGMLVTTSYLHSQAYKEIKEDGHPIVILSGGDIVEVLVRSGIATIGHLEEWVKQGATG